MLQSFIMRIIGGLYKNRVIPLKGENVRPTSIRARVTIFDILTNLVDFENATFLDCFAGSGALGIEALSRKAKKAIFFDIDKVNCKTIKDYLSKLNIPGSYDVLQVNSLCPPNGQPADVIFLDPPYRNDFIIPKLFKKLKKYNWYNDDTIFVLETWKKTSLKNDKLGITPFKERLFGKALVRFFKFGTLSDIENNSESASVEEILEDIESI